MLFTGKKAVIFALIDDLMIDFLLALGFFYTLFNLLFQLILLLHFLDLPAGQNFLALTLATVPLSAPLNLSSASS